MSTGFFKKFTPVGSIPIVPQERVVKTSRADAGAPAASSSAAAASTTSEAGGHRRRKLPALPPPSQLSQPLQHPRRAASTVILAVTTPTSSSASCSTTSRVIASCKPAAPKRGRGGLEPSRSTSTPNLKQSAPSSRGSLKPPSPDSFPRLSPHPHLQPHTHQHLQHPHQHHQRSAASSRSPFSQRLESSDDDEYGSDDDDDDERSSKRSKLGSASPAGGGVVDPARRTVHPISFRTKDPQTGLPVERCNFIHAFEIANVKHEGWFKPREFRIAQGTTPAVGLHYPGIADQECFHLVQNVDPDEFNPLAEILATMEMVADYLLPPALAAQVCSETSGGIVYRLRRALKHGDYLKFLDQLKAYNELVRASRCDGSVKRRIAAMTAIPFKLVEHILQQSYARTVALEVEGLKDYQAFSSEVYGELLPKFTTKIFKEAHLTSDKVFVDLGSGTGNVVLHAALECGCESWGCEKMDKPAQLADRQHKEFVARCRMWGINPGRVHLHHDTFLENGEIAAALKRADVLLVNNFAFEPDLNQKLLDMFLDLKEGAQIFSLKPFVPANHVITTRNAENPVNRLRMVEREYFSREVSWTDSGGKYYVHTVDGSMLRDFIEREERGVGRGGGARE